MVKLELKDKTPFFICPYPVKEDGKKVIDDEMWKGCLLGYLKCCIYERSPSSDVVV